MAQRKARTRRPRRRTRPAVRQLTESAGLEILRAPEPEPVPVVVDEPHPHPPGHHFEMWVQDDRGRWVELNPADLPTWRGETDICTCCGLPGHTADDCEQGHGAHGHTHADQGMHGHGAHGHDH